MSNYSNVTNVEKGLITITLTKYPIPLEDDARIAEEILHSMLDIEGYPSVMTTKETPANLGPILNNVFHDPIIYLRLINDYGFELCSKNKIDLKDTQRQLKKHSSAPSSGSLDRVAWLFNYAGNVLELEVACGETNRDLNIFRQWFAPRFPEVASEGDKLLELIESTGYDTPEKLNILLNKIIEKYDLQDKLIVVQKNQPPIR